MSPNNNDLEKRLWDAADELRANSRLRAAEYSVPVLGLIFLRYADHRFAAADEAIQAEQRRIVACIEALFAQADALEKAATAAHRRLEQVDQAILARAFRGELVDQDPTDEPASALLERIEQKRGQST